MAGTMALRISSSGEGGATGAGFAVPGLGMEGKRKLPSDATFHCES